MIQRKTRSSFYTLLVLCGALFLMQCSSGQTTEEAPTTTERGSGDGLTGCVEGDCTNGTGTYVYETGDKYIGGFKNGLRDGSGAMMYANGDIYKGPYVADKRTGEGTYTFANGDVYNGEFRDGLRGGQGEYVWKEDGAIFKGEFAQDGASGKGILIVAGQQKECVLEQRKVICEDGSSRETEQG
ncbi:MAG: hypothetical protein CMF59_12370 [Leptospiraceae bacterium]|nr:hypothetical protein [Leptospiraceae bacterium]